MNLRTKQLEATKELILDAAEEMIFSDANPSAVTMQAIADRAGVSHRTLYRHFENRDELISALGRRMDAQADDHIGISEPATFEEWIGGVETAMKFGAAFREQLRRAWALGVTTSAWRRDRDDKYYEMFRGRFPHLDEDTALQDFAALRHLYGSASVLMIGERFRLSPEEVAATVQRAVEAMVVAIDARDKAAAKG